MAKEKKEVVAEVKEVVEASEVKEVVEPVVEVKNSEEVVEGKEEKVSEVVTPSTEDAVLNTEETVDVVLNTEAAPESFTQEQMDAMLNEVFTVPGESVEDLNEKYPVLDIDVLAEKINLLYNKDKGDSATFREAYETCRWNCIRFGLPLKNYDEI